MSRELLFSLTRKDLDISFFSGTGKGGQNRNKHQNCVRMQHKESGVMVTAQRERSREQNLQIAFENLVEHPKFKIWHKKKCAEMSISKEQKEHERLRLEELVHEAMSDENILIEVKDANGNWVKQDKLNDELPQCEVIRMHDNKQCEEQGILRDLGPHMPKVVMCNKCYRMGV